MEPQLTLRVGRRRHLVHRVRDGHISSLQDVFVQLLLLKLVQLLLEFAVVDRVRDGCPGDGRNNLLAERVLIS